MAKIVVNKSLGDRLAQARKAAGLSQTALGEAVGMKQTAIAEIEGGRVLRPKKLREIARTVGATEDWLLADAQNLIKPNKNIDPDTNQVRIPNVTKLKILGFVRAGTWQEIDTMSQLEGSDYTAAPDPSFSADEQFLLRVQGDSMNASTPVPMPDGCLVKCVSFAAWGGDLRPRELVIVHKVREQGGLVEATAKRVSVENGNYVLSPESTNPAHKPIKIKKNGSDDDTDVLIFAVILNIIFPQDQIR